MALNIAALTFTTRTPTVDEHMLAVAWLQGDNHWSLMELAQKRVIGPFVGKDDMLALSPTDFREMANAIIRAMNTGYLVETLSDTEPPEANAKFDFSYADALRAREEEEQAHERPDDTHNGQADGGAGHPDGSDFIIAVFPRKPSRRNILLDKWRRQLDHGDPPSDGA